MNIKDKPYWVIDLLESPPIGKFPGLIQTHASFAETIEEANEIADRISKDTIKGHVRHAIIP